MSILSKSLNSFFLIFMIISFFTSHVISRNIPYDQQNTPRNQQAKNQESKVYIGYHGTNGRLYANNHRDIVRGERIKCVRFDNLITDSFLRDDVRSVDCGTDDTCKSIVLSIKLGLCLGGLRDCDITGVRSSGREYYGRVFKRIKTHSHPQLWNLSSIKHLDKTIIGSELIAQVHEFDKQYVDMVDHIHRVLEKEKSENHIVDDLIIKSISKHDWYLYRIMALSRGFSVQINGKTAYVMIPHLDTVNHGFKKKNEASAIWGYEDLDRRICIYSTKHISKGTQILYDYGITEARQSCLNYGIYDESLNLSVYFNKASEQEIIRVRRNELFDTNRINQHIKELNNVDTDTMRDLCRSIASTTKYYDTVLGDIDKINQKTVKNMCLVKILRDEKQIIDTVGSWVC